MPASFSKANLYISAFGTFLVIFFLGSARSVIPAPFQISPPAATNNRSEAHYAKGLEFLQAKKYDHAIAEFDLAIKVDPNYHYAYRKIAQAFDAQKQKAPSNALPYFETLKSRYPNNAVVYYGLGLAYQRQALNEKALENLQTSIKLNADFAEAYSQLVEAYKSMKRLSEAEMFMQEWIAQKPDNAVAHYGLGYVYQLQSQWEKGLASQNQAQALNPEMMAAYLSNKQFGRNLSQPEKFCCR